MIKEQDPPKSERNSPSTKNQSPSSSIGRTHQSAPASSSGESWHSLSFEYLEDTSAVFEAPNARSRLLPRIVDPLAFDGETSVTTTVRGGSNTSVCKEEEEDTSHKTMKNSTDFENCNISIVDDKGTKIFNLNLFLESLLEFSMEETRSTLLGAHQNEVPEDDAATSVGFEEYDSMECHRQRLMMQDTTAFRRVRQHSKPHDAEEYEQ